MFDLYEELTPEKRDKILTQISAKASWGDPKEETHRFAIQEGLSAEEVTAHVNHAYLKRENVVRKAGTSYLMVAAVMLIISIILVVLIVFLNSVILSNILSLPLFYLLIVALYKLFKGISLVTVGDKFTCLTKLEGARNLPGIMKL